MRRTGAVRPESLLFKVQKAVVSVTPEKLAFRLSGAGRLCHAVQLLPERFRFGHAPPFKQQKGVM
jgi:hypothetical protein